MIEFTDAEVESMARQMVELGGGNPDMMVTPGAPEVYGTPVGPAVAIAGLGAVKMWTLYREGARRSLEMAYRVIQRRAEVPTAESAAA